MVWVIMVAPLLHFLALWFVRVSGSGIALDFEELEWLPLVLAMSYPFLLAIHGTILWIASRFRKMAFRIPVYASAWSLLGLALWLICIVNWPDYGHRNDNQAMMAAYRDVVVGRALLALKFCLSAVVTVAVLDWSRTALGRKRRA